MENTGGDGGRACKTPGGKLKEREGEKGRAAQDEWGMAVTAFPCFLGPPLLPLASRHHPLSCFPEHLHGPGTEIGFTQRRYLAAVALIFIVNHSLSRVLDKPGKNSKC